MDKPVAVPVAYIVQADGGALKYSVCIIVRDIQFITVSVDAFPVIFQFVRHIIHAQAENSLIIQGGILDIAYHELQSTLLYHLLGFQRSVFLVANPEIHSCHQRLDCHFVHSVLAQSQERVIQIIFIIQRVVFQQLLGLRQVFQNVLCNDTGRLQGFLVGIEFRTPGQAFHLRVFTIYRTVQAKQVKIMECTQTQCFTFHQIPIAVRKHNIFSFVLQAVKQIIEVGNGSKLVYPNGVDIPFGIRIILVIIDFRTRFVRRSNRYVVVVVTLGKSFYIIIRQSLPVIVEQGHAGIYTYQGNLETVFRFEQLVGFYFIFRADIHPICTGGKEHCHYNPST